MDILVCYKGSDFEKWGAQFKKKDSINRKVVLIEPASDHFKIREKTMNAVARASKMAQNGLVILALGHGGGDETDTSKAMVDFGRKRAFRIQQDTLNYSADDLKSDKKIIQFASPIKNRCSALAKYKHPPSHKAREDWDKCIDAKEAKKRIDIRKKFVKIGDALRSNNIKQVIFLSCNVGKGQAFLNKLGTQWGVKVTGYKHRLAVGKDSQGIYRVYFLKDKRDGQGSNTERARSELPPLDQSYTSGGNPYQPGQTTIPIR
jgi:hypothetical protein